MTAEINLKHLAGHVMTMEDNLLDSSLDTLELPPAHLSVLCVTVSPDPLWWSTAPPDLPRGSSAPLPCLGGLLLRHGEL